MGNFFPCYGPRSNDEPELLRPRVEFSEAKPVIVNQRLVAVNDPNVKLGQDPRLLRLRNNRMKIEGRSVLPTV